MKPSFGSLFAGAGGFDIGFEQAGWECSWQVEWDKNCQKVLSHNWPDIPKYLDVQTVSGYQLAPVDTVIFGSPCQDLSVAGRRAGLVGDKSSMFFEATRIIKEMRNATGNQYPRVAVWENVPGSLTSNKGADFAAVLDEMANIGALAIEWHVLDAQWFGVPQRRRRVFLVASFDPAIVRRGGQQILPIAENSAGDLKKIRAKRGSDSTSFEEGSDESLGGLDVFVKARRAQSSEDYETWESGRPSPTLNAFDNASESRATVLIVDGTRTNDFRVYDDGTVPTLKARMGTGGGQVPLVSRPDQEYRLRRLTPLECERLMGFPDNHTKYGNDGKVISDTNRYKMIGNAVAVPVSKWVANNLKVLM
jgi:DNA (cytosine-5)-methyltransferase 1